MIRSFVCLAEIVDKIENKHQITVKEVEEVFKPGTILRRRPRGKKRRGEDVYKAYGRTEAGRYLFVAFIYKLDSRALILSARDMDESERHLYQKG